MTTSRLRQIHDVTDNFFFWQGLRLIPMGIAMLVAGLTSSAAVPIPHAARQWIPPPLLAIAVWLSLSVLGRYYANRFGRVASDPSRHTVRTSIKWFVVCPAIAGALVIH